MKASAKSFVVAGLIAACLLSTSVPSAAQYGGRVSVDNNTDWYTQRGEPTDMPGRIVYMPKARYVKQMQEVGPDQCIPPNPSWTLVAQNDTHCWYEVPQQQGPNDEAWKTGDGVASCHDQGGGTLYCEIRKIVDGVGLVIDVWRAFKNRVPGQPVMPGCVQLPGTQLCPGKRQVLGSPQGPITGGTRGGPGTTPGPPGGGGSGGPGNGGTPGGGAPGPANGGGENAGSAQQGLAKGFAECGQAFANLGKAALALVHPQLILQNRNYVVAAQYMGITSSDQGLRFLYSELTQPAIGVAKDANGQWHTTVPDDQAGTRIARKICFWGLPAVVTKMAKELRPSPKPPRGPPSEPPTGSPSEPPLLGALSEAQVLETFQQVERALAERGGKNASDAAKAEAKSARNLEGKVVQLPPGQGLSPGRVTLGERIGDGHFGDVYTIEGAPSLVVKVIHKLEGGAASVTRELNGDRLAEGLVSKPAIHGSRAVEGGLSYVIKDRLQNVEFPTSVTPELQPWIGRVYGELARNGRVWLDGHVQNTYVVRNAAGRIIDIGIHDTDMINMANDPAIAPEMGRLVSLFQAQPNAMMRMFEYNTQLKQGTLNGRAFMRDVYQLRFGVAPPF